MEKFSKIIHKKRIPVEIAVHSYWFDHQFMGKAVLPAVEAIGILVNSTQTHIENIGNADIFNAAFDKFLFLKENEDSIAGFNDIEVYKDGLVQSKLVTRFQSGKTSITRLIEHVTINLSLFRKPVKESAFDSGSLLDKDSFEIAPEIIYKQLVPFGPAYQNIRNSILLNPNGAVASVSGGHPHESNRFRLGSPFTLDAAFHAACAWGQRYHHVVAFPVGFSERHILRPTCFGNPYVALIKPVHSDKKMLIFDIRIEDRKGNIYETVSGLRMRDVSRGRLKPPEWILDKDQVPV